MYGQSGQYLSEGTQEPTITLGNQYEGEIPRQGSRGKPKEQNYNNMISQQQLQNMHYQYEKQLQICHSEMQSLKEQIELDEKQKIALEETIIQLKKQRAASDNENRKLFQENEKNRQLVQRLKIDNRSFQMEIDKFKSERKQYYATVNNIQTLKKDITEELALKRMQNEELTKKLKQIERNHSDCRFRMEQLENQCISTEKEKEQLKEQLKITLEKYLNNGNLLAKVEYQLKQVNDLNKSLKDRVYELQKQKEELFIKLGYDLSASKQNALSESNRSNFPTNQRSMIEIQSYMKEIGNLLDLKREDAQKRRKNYDKLKLSIQSLQNYL